MRLPQPAQSCEPLFWWGSAFTSIVILLARTPVNTEKRHQLKHSAGSVCTQKAFILGTHAPEAELILIKGRKIWSGCARAIRVDSRGNKVRCGWVRVEKERSCLCFRGTRSGRLNGQCCSIKRLKVATERCHGNSSGVVQCLPPYYNGNRVLFIKAIAKSPVELFAPHTTKSEKTMAWRQSILYIYTLSAPPLAQRDAPTASHQLLYRKSQVFALKEFIFWSTLIPGK